MFRCLKAWPERRILPTFRFGRAGILFCLVSILLTACGSNVRAPITDKNVTKSTSAEQRTKRVYTKPGRKPAVYTVVRGDTLQAIAWRFGLDHEQLARWNRIRNANLIFVGQKLRLTPPKISSSPRATDGSDVRARVPKQPRVNVVKKVAGWRWPAAGKVQKATSALGTKGIEIRGKRGSPIVAAAAGKVVYSGNGLRGYGNLIIVQHNETYLSAYAHNEKLLISEGEKVSAGQRIATMGNSGTKQVMLHFEIRRNGKAVEPTNYLPRQ